MTLHEEPLIVTLLQGFKGITGCLRIAEGGCQVAVPDSINQGISMYYSVGCGDPTPVIEHC